MPGRTRRARIAEAERELLLRQLDRLAAQAHDPRRGVDLELADAQPTRAAAGVGTAQQRLDPRPQLGIAEGLAFYMGYCRIAARAT